MLYLQETEIQAEIPMEMGIETDPTHYCGLGLG